MTLITTLYLICFIPALASEQEILEEEQRQVNVFYDEDEFAHFDLVGPATVTMSNLLVENAVSFGYRFYNDQFFRESIACSIILGKLVLNWILG